VKLNAPQLNVRRHFPREVRTIEHAWIPLRDGCRLAARIWLPIDAEQSPVPAVLEYIPYRKNDGTVISDALRHPYFAGHGYAALRVDLRGTGDSDGLIFDEYLAQEQEDALDVLAWLEQQPWCTGAVGMMGYSWGGFNALQVAARRPKQLKAIVTVHSADDRYGGDCHYIGGKVLAYDMLSWGITAFAYNLRPPDPAVVGDQWRDRWRERIEAAEPYVHAWLSHQLYDDYWKHGSVCEDYDAIECAVLTVGGWADPYHDTVLRLLEHLKAPRRGLIGPWAHQYPDEASPGPRIGFNQECLRWWDHWLKGIDTGVMDEPLLRAYVLDAEEPATFYAHRAGHWAGVDECPGATSIGSAVPLSLGAHTLGSPSSSGQDAVSLREVEASGLAAGTWCPHSGKAALPGDQRPDDALSLSFDSEPLSEPLEILGFPSVDLEVAADTPLAFLAVRLCDVSPSGSVSLVTRGVLNLAQRDDRACPLPLEPGTSNAVHMTLGSIGYRFPPGHRLRLTVAPTYWPWVWPSPEPVTLTLKPSACRLNLPVRGIGVNKRPEFSPVEVAPPLEIEVLDTLTGRATTTHDLLSDRVEMVVEPDGLPGRVRLVESGLVVGEWGRNTYAIVEGDPLSASVRCERTMEIGGPGWKTVTKVDSTMSCDDTAFYIETHLSAHEADEPFIERSWSWSTPRVMG
jgi:putative CocE/NonD family hydrolase